MKIIYLMIFLSFFSISARAGDNENKINVKNTITASLVNDISLKAGKESKIIIKLYKQDGTAVLPEDLKLVHTQKIHALIIDPSFSDYNHKHPLPTKNAGEYEFSFTPKIANNYRLWLDITPVKSPHEYIMLDLKGANTANVNIEKKEILEASVLQNNKKYKLSLSFDAKPEVGKAVMGNIHILDSNGNDFTKLQPVMGAFAHIVGFYPDYKNIVHIHPMGKEPSSPNDLGGPDLKFHIEAEQKGFMKLFAQIRINDEDVFVPFAINIE